MFVIGLSMGRTVLAESELTIGRIDIPSFRWGRQIATFEVTSNSDWMKFITVETEIRFKGSYLNPERIVHTHYPLEPGQSRILTPQIDVPGNYGKAVLSIRLYDVIDTLDAILPGQQVFEQPFHLTFHIPDKVASYFQEKVLLPPMVVNNPIWDNEFAHLLPLLLNEGKSIGEIASMTESDTGFVQSVIDRMIEKGFLEIGKDSIAVPNFPVFSVKQAEETKKLVEKYSDQFAELILANMENFHAVRDSLVEVRALTSDSNDFLHGGTVLYRPFPVISGLLLWYRLGQAFITGREPLTVFSGTDPCNALIGKYMYAVHGGDIFNGHHYYNLMRTGKRLDITYGDSIPEIICAENFTARIRLRERVDYRPAAGYIPELFTVSAKLVRPVLAALSQDSDKIIYGVRDGLIAISASYGHEQVTVAERYWFWNQFATRTLDKLVKKGVIDRRGNGQYKFTVSQ